MKAPASTASEPAWLAVVREKVESLRYGVVQIVVHDGRVTLIERTEKTRLEEYSADRSAGGLHTQARPGTAPTGAPKVHSAASHHE